LRVLYVKDWGKEAGECLKVRERRLASEKTQWGQGMCSTVQKLQAGCVETRVHFFSPEYGGGVAFNREGVLERDILTFFERLEKIGTYSGETDVNDNALVDFFVIFSIYLELDRQGKVEALVFSFFGPAV
jgi:hypothetical protein